MGDFCKSVTIKAEIQENGIIRHANNGLYIGRLDGVEFTHIIDIKPPSFFDFGTALELLKKGKKVKRAIWGGYWFFAPNPDCKQDGNDGFNRYFTFKNGLIVAVLKDNGGCAPAQPYQADLLAEDWMLVD